MGCTSSKQRTTSVEDLAAEKKDSSSSKKNGKTSQVDGIRRDKGGGDAIQIPGTHTSFLAPDGIPFIDEDVEDDAETRGGTTVVSNAAPTTKPDVNRNVVQPRSVSEQPASSGSKTEDEKRQEIGAEIMKREMEITQNAGSTGMFLHSSGIYDLRISAVRVDPLQQSCPWVHSV